MVGRKFTPYGQWLHYCHAVGREGSASVARCMAVEGESVIGQVLEKSRVGAGVGHFCCSVALQVDTVPRGGSSQEGLAGGVGDLHWASGV